MNVTDLKVSDEDGSVPQHDDESKHQDDEGANLMRWCHQPFFQTLALRCTMSVSLQRKRSRINILISTIGNRMATCAEAARWLHVLRREADCTRFLFVVHMCSVEHVVLR